LETDNHRFWILLPDSIVLSPREEEAQDAAALVVLLGLQEVLKLESTPQLEAAGEECVNIHVFLLVLQLLDLLTQVFLSGEKRRTLLKVVGQLVLAQILPVDGLDAYGHFEVEERTLLVRVFEPPPAFESCPAVLVRVLADEDFRVLIKFILAAKVVPV